MILHPNDHAHLVDLSKELINVGQQIESWIDIDPNMLDITANTLENYALVLKSIRNCIDLRQR